jgi:hypothetical protein
MNVLISVKLGINIMSLKVIRSDSFQLCYQQTKQAGVVVTTDTQLAMCRFRISA